MIPSRYKDMVPEDGWTGALSSAKGKKRSSGVDIPKGEAFKRRNVDFDEPVDGLRAAAPSNFSCTCIFGTVCYARWAVSAFSR